MFVHTRIKLWHPRQHLLPLLQHIQPQLLLLLLLPLTLQQVLV
jgi:hypothetical protein